MAGYRFNKEEYFKETKAVYSNYPTDVSRMEKELDRLQKENPKASSFQKKTWIYRTAARDAEVILFPSSPFYAEIDTGREQNSVTASFPPQPGIGCWLMKQYPDFVDGYGEWSGYYGKYGVMNGPQFMDAAHHYANCETVLKYGSIRNNQTCNDASGREKSYRSSAGFFKMHGRRMPQPAENL